MNKRIKLHTLVAAVLASAFSLAAQAGDCTFSEGRGGLCGWYASEISGSRAFIDTVVLRGAWTRPNEQAVIIDVRSLPEYRAGHPDFAINAPYPFVYQLCTAAGRTEDGACIAKTYEEPQSDAAFVAFVESKVADKSTPIYTLCRTGHRSVLAANVLTDAGYTNVHNIWEGFVGNPLYAPKLVDGVMKQVQVDLNHDGVLNDHDKNGWRNHLGLPYDTKLLPPLLYTPYQEYYRTIP